MSAQTPAHKPIVIPAGGAPPARPAPLALHEFDPIVFNNELLKLGLLPPAIPAQHQHNWLESLFCHKSRAGVPQPAVVAPPLSKSIQAGTFKGTQKALTAAYSGLLSSYGSFFDIAGFEPSLPRERTDLDGAKRLYNWSIPSDKDDYPPHLATIPDTDKVGLTSIFNILRLAQTAPLLIAIIPDTILDWVGGKPGQGDTMAALTQRNHDLRKKGDNVFNQPNLGDREDWYTDAVFAQQQLTGTNPVTLEIASAKWIDAFKTVALAQKNQAMADIIGGKASDSDARDSFYVQDYSWFRTAIGLGPSETIQSDDSSRKTCAPVVLFRLTGANGKLHPLAICIDFKVSLDQSVTIFNKRLRETDDRSGEETDWPWRYAKTAFHSADWHCHEIGVHLTESHFIEEATIVAANRAFPETHMVSQLLSPHWFKTLSLNAAARSALVPNVIRPIAGMKKADIHAFAKYIYKTYDFTAHYIPQDLEKRGFPLKELQTTKFRNCAYARNMQVFWGALRKFVSTVLHAEFNSDLNVKEDPYVKAWTAEMRDPKGGDLASFPVIETIDALVDAVTACIHIASPLHSAVNYLQNYYYAFVASKPPALFTPLPESLDRLMNIKEEDLLAALPVNHPRDWLLASHIPWLLSYQVAENQNILNWVSSVAFATARNPDDQALSAAARTLWEDMQQVAAVVKHNSEDMDDQGTPYFVLNPQQVAVSILI